MKLIANVFWFILAGLWLGLFWALAGLLWCITILGIPWGVQCFKFARLAFAPFGKEIVYGGGPGSVILNVLWLLLTGAEMAAAAAAWGLVLCITIVGIPWGLQCFKMAKLALLPFGSRVQ